MSEVEQLISQISIPDVARQLGVDEQTAQEAVSAAIPALLGGMGANAQHEEGAQSLDGALQQHSTKDPERMFDVQNADVEDGQKIVRHVFGGNEEQVVQQLSGARPALGSGMLAKLLPLLAPLVLQWLASKWTQRGGAAGGSASRQRDTGSSSGDGVGFPPAGFPGSGDRSQPQARQEADSPSSGGGLGDLIGDLLGGKGGGLGDLLGGMFGGKR